MIKANTPIRVFNHNSSSISMSGQMRDYMLDGSRGLPTVLTMDFSDVEYINARTPVFQNGRLRFDESEQEEIYKALHLDNWRETTLFDEDIEHIIASADEDGLRKFVAVKDVATIQRIRGHLISMCNSSQHDISNRVTNLIETRCDEINRGVRESKIEVGKVMSRMAQDEDPRIAAMQEQLAAMQAKMEEMLAAQSKEPAEMAEKAPAKRRTTQTKKPESGDKA